MAKLVFGMNMTLDGFVDHDGGFVPDSVLFAYFVEQTRNTAGSIYGRVLYETMRYWDGDAWVEDSPARGDLQAFAQAWRAMPKWVVSRSLKEVGANATLLGADFEAEIRRIKAEREGVIEVGGPKLAAFLGERGLIDEYHVFLHPFVLGRGTPFFGGARPKLRMAGCERIGDSAVKLTYVPA
jgi:dihydrofolate reductase